jgi:hypothetical protein
MIRPHLNPRVLKGEMILSRRRLLGDKGQLKVIIDAVHHAIVSSDSDLSLVGNMESGPGDELQVVQWKFILVPNV